MKISQIMGANIASKVQKTNSNSYVSRPNLVNKADSVSFSSKYVEMPINVDLDTAKFVANSLSTSTSGHRGVYGSDIFNPEIVELLTVGVAKYAKEEAAKKDKKPLVMIGGDTRVATRESLPLIKDVLTGQNIDVLYIEKPVPTPMLALAAQDYDVDIAVLMTASHNPWEDGGYNLVTRDGAIAPAEVTQKVAEKVVETAKDGKYYDNIASTASTYTFFPYDSYKEHLDSLNLIDWKTIKEADIDLYYDPLNGTGKEVFPELLNEKDIPVTLVESKPEEGPNPVAKNFGMISEKIKNSEAPLVLGLATDGDADRFSVIDENGNFITGNDVVLLAGYHMAKNKGQKGALIRSQATSSQLDEVGKKYNLPVYQTPVGFKYIAEDIMELRKEGKDTLVSGEESGGMTIKGHIPEKDGLAIDLLMLDLVAKEKKPVSQILKDVKEELGINKSSVVTSKKLSSESDKNIIMNRFKEVFESATTQDNMQFGIGFIVDKDKTVEHAKIMEKYRKGGDGYKIYFVDGSSVLVRKSGTEPLVKYYIETTGVNKEESQAKLENLQGEMNKIFTL